MTAHNGTCVRPSIMPVMDAGVVALIPAAGRGRRLGDGAMGSKEVVDVAGEPVAGHLLRRLALAEIRQALVVLREGKWDVPSALLGYRSLDLALRYVIVGDTRSELHSVAEGLAFAGRDLVALGYPDVLFEPNDAFSALLNRQSRTGADLVLGLFPSDIPQRVDMVALDSNMAPVEIVIKQPDRGLRYSWSIAVWTPSFSRYLIDFVSNIDNDSNEQSPKDDPQELSVGHVVQDALVEGFAVEAVIFREGSYLDIGTPDDLAEARRIISG